ncbi:MAG: LysE family translocator [Opitutus sp.]|nr:LysE family translocator [Opitutus sp.]
MSPLVQGLVIGFSIAAPVGPIGLLCLRRSLADGRLAGFVSGLGAATADALYGAVAALGLTAITRVLLDHRALLQLGGGVFLLYLGLATLRAKPGDAGRAETPLCEAKAGKLSAAYFSLVGLTLANPLTILSFVGIFAGLGVGATAGGGWPAFRLVLGVFLGSAAWWLLLSSAAGWLGRQLAHGGLRTINFASGLVIAGFGAWQLAALI